MSSIVSPAEWGAAVDYDSWDDLSVLKDKIIIHYNGPPVGDVDEKDFLCNVEQFHLTKSWRGIAYGWAIGQSGTVYRLRGWNRYGAHTGDVDADGINENDEGIPVFFMLGGNEPPTAEMLHAFIGLKKFLQGDARSMGPNLPVFGHRDVSNTSCPGDITYELIQQKFWETESESMLTEEQEAFLAAFADGALGLDPAASGTSYAYLLRFYRDLASRYGIAGNRPEAIAERVTAIPIDPTARAEAQKANESLSRVKSVLP